MVSLAICRLIQDHIVFHKSKGHMPQTPVEPDMIPVDKWVGGCKAVYILIGRSGCIVRALLHKSRYPFASLNVSSST